MIISEGEVRSAVASFQAAPDRWKVREADPPPEPPDEELARARTLYDVLPPYRFSRVNEIRQAIGEGRYHVPSEQIVEKILGRLTVDALA